MRKNLLLFFLLAASCAYAQNNDPLKLPLGELLGLDTDTTSHSGRAVPLGSIAALNSGLQSIDSKSDWFLVSYESHSWRQLVGQPRYDYSTLRLPKRPQMLLSADLITREFKLGNANSRWRVNNGPDGKLTISSYAGNPIANVTSWEITETYTFQPAGQHMADSLVFENLLSESADPGSFLGVKNSTDTLIVLQPFVMNDTSRWQLLGYDQSGWTDILGRDKHETSYRKYVAKQDTVLDGKTLKKELGPLTSVAGIQSDITEPAWTAYLANDVLLIRRGIYQPGNMTDWGFTQAYYFRKAK